VSAGALLGVVALGVAAGMVSGLFGVGGGIVFVPALAVVLGLGQLRAEATSLLAILPVAAVGAWQQGRYGNLRLREGLSLGALAAGGSFAGVALANVVPERALELAFAGLALVVATQLTRRALRAPAEPTRGGG
jgi:uncharacterized membrane protein YfcA